MQIRKLIKPYNKDLIDGYGGLVIAYISNVTSSPKAKVDSKQQKLK